jgi:hypothetical protein
MYEQIRITKTPILNLALQALKKKKFPTLDESEIIKYLIGKAVTELDEEKEYLKMAEYAQKFYVEDKDDKVNYDPVKIKRIKK